MTRTMKPQKIEIYLYAENDEQVREAEKAAYEFVTAQYNRGNIVTAVKFTEIARKFKDNYFVSQYLNK